MLTASGFILLRKLKVTHFLVSPTYVNFWLMIVCFIIVHIKTMDISIYSVYEPADYVGFFMTGFLMLVGQAAKAWALQYDTASRIGVL